MRLKALLIVPPLLCLAACELRDTAPHAPGVVDVEKVLRDSRAAQAARVHLSQARANLQKGLEMLETEYKDAPENERREVLAEGLMALNRQMATEEQAASQVVLQMMREEVSAWRKSSKAPYVMERRNLLDVDAELDVTAAIIEEMNKREPKFAAPPRVEVRKREAPRAGESGSQQGKKDEKKPTLPVRR